MAEGQCNTQKPGLCRSSGAVRVGLGIGAQYGYNRTEVHGALAALLEQDHLRLESPALVRQALLLFAGGPADFSDYLLAARTQAAGYSPVLTLDKKAAGSATHQLLR